MAEEIKATMGRKVEPGADTSKVGKTVSTQQEAGGSDEVGGRALFRNLVIDPNCGAAVWIVEDSKNYRMYRCSNCGGLFYK